ncbi:Uncharacterised protein [BD1-7 clade bacterium]|uniref:Methyltransferase type 11 domain-containing protein n=1 Tax=BD1-7 clade bacterium TaxID=2029982 RepID=A0A5S9QN60_9GAMM|nr:Uncharacterised protein [BD1-7 clade bacterium]
MEQIKENDWVKPTVDNRGLMFKKMIRNSQAFVDSTGKFDKPVLDLGCAYGVATIPTLEKGQAVIACDLEQRHLDQLIDAVPKTYHPLLMTVCASFPDGIELPDESISAALSSYVFHFLKGPELQIGLQKIYRWLQPGGKLYINVGTPFIKNFDTLDAFHQRKEKGERWPGELYEEDIPEHFQAKFSEESRCQFMHLFTVETMTRELEGAGFEVESSFYDELVMCDEYREFFSGGGKGVLCLVAQRPNPDIAH